MPKKKSPADLILENANVICYAPHIPGPIQAIAIRGERIVHVGANSEMAILKDASTQVIDCCGKTLLPGFNDAHCHFFALAKKLLSIDFSPAKAGSIGDIQRLVRDKAVGLPPGTWIRGTSYNEFYLAEKRHPTRHDLDQAAPHHPVVITHRSLHACVLNTRAMELAGITNETPEPPGSLIERDLDTGEPNGILFEMDEFLRQRIPSAISGSEMEQAVRKASTHLLSLGITSFGEATATNGLPDWETYARLKKDDKIASRIYMMFGASALEEIRKAGLKPLSGNHQLRLGSVKVTITTPFGVLHPSQSELNEIVTQADKAGFQAALHAVEQRAVETAVTALEYTRAERGPADAANPRRHRIEHCSECPPEFVARLKKLSVVVVSQPPFIYFNGERYLADVPPSIQETLYPFGSLQKAGLIVAASSDSPVVPANPLIGVYAAVTRLSEANQILLSKEGISPVSALNMYTANGAFASFAEMEQGRIQPGMLADVVVLSENPLKCPPARIKDIKVVMTVIGGRVAWQAGKPGKAF